MKRWLAVLSILLSSFQSPSVADEETGITETSVSFGSSYPMTGPASPGLSSYYSGIEAYFAFINENGGIYGRKLNLIRSDDKNVSTLAVVNNMNLINRDQVLGLISSAPSCATQLGTLSSVNPSATGVPNIFVDCYLDRTADEQENSSSTNNRTTFYGKLSTQNQILLLKSYFDKEFSSQKIALVYQSDDSKLAVEKITTDSRIQCTKTFLAGTESFTMRDIIEKCNKNGGLRDGDVVIYAGGPAGLGFLINLFEQSKLNLRYFATDNSLNRNLFSILGVQKNSVAEIYTVSHNALISEKTNKIVASFLSIGERFQSRDTVDQRFLDGINVGYVVANVVSATGKDLTRDRFLKAMSLYGAQFDALGLSDRSKEDKTRFMPQGGVIVKNVGSSSEAVTEVLTIEDGKIVVKPRMQRSIAANGLPALVQLLAPSLPSPAPTQTPKTESSSESKAPKESSTPIPEFEGDEEEPFGKITIKKDKGKFAISISSNLPVENLQVRATKKGQKSISFKITTDEDGQARFVTSRNLTGFRVALFLEGELLTSVRVN